MLPCLQVLYALAELGLQRYDSQQFGIAQYLYATGAFWFTLLVCAIISFGHRLVERGYVWLFRPQVRSLLSCVISPRTLSNVSIDRSSSKHNCSALHQISTIVCRLVLDGSIPTLIKPLPFPFPFVPS